MLKLGLVLGVLASCTGMAEAYEGYSAQTRGGANLYYVTSLADSGPGTLRDAVSVGNRTVRFAVAGDIFLATEIRVRGAKVLIDASSAPYPGITLRNRGLIIRGTDGANNVIVQGIRVRDALNDGIQIANNAYNVVVDQVSVLQSLDGQIDITEGAWNVIVSNSLLVGDKGMLIKYANARRSSIHHNFMICNQRCPQVSSEGVDPLDLHADIRNNVIVEASPPTLHGVLVWFAGAANVVNNLFIGPRWRDVFQAQSPYVYAAGNRMYAGSGTPGGGTRATPFPAPYVTTYEACTGAGIAANAGTPFPDDARETGIFTWLDGYIASLPVGQGC